jgi:hypothetical protein
MKRMNHEDHLLAPATDLSCDCAGCGFPRLARCRGYNKKQGILGMMAHSSWKHRPVEKRLLAEIVCEIACPGREDKQ